MQKKIRFPLPDYLPFLCLLLLLFNTHSAIAQQELKPERQVQDFCYTTEINQMLREQYPQLGSAEEFEKILQEKVKKYKEDLSLMRINEKVYTLPVVFHIIHNGEPVGTGANLSQELINNEIKMVNDNLRRRPGTHGYSTNPVSADVGIELAPALRDPQGRTLSEPGIHRFSFQVYRPGMTRLEVLKNIESALKPATAWDTRKYLNIWVINYNDAPIVQKSYAITPIAINQPYSIKDLNKADGIVLDRLAVFSANLGTTTTHELGHWLGLIHTWGNSNPNNNCSGNDFCDDTPTHNGPTYGCPQNIDTCPQPGLDPIDNYMNYTDTDCQNTFTNDQKIRMRTVLTNLFERMSLINSRVHLPDNGKPTAFFEADRTVACASSTEIHLSDKSTNNPTSWQWSFYDSSGDLLGIFTQQHITVNFGGVDSYSVQLIARNSKGSDTLLLPGYLLSVSNTNLLLPKIEDLETRPILNNWLIYNKDNDGFGWNVVRQFSNFINVIGANGNPTTVLHWGRLEQYTSIVKGELKEDWLISPRIDLGLYPNAEISFDLAYKPIYGSGDPVFDDRELTAEFTTLDTLSILYSTNCGLTYTTLWKKGGNDLASVTPGPNGQSIFIPTAATQWKREKISLSDLNEQSNVSLAFVLSSGISGQNLYIDNLEISVPPVTKAPVPNFTVTTASVCEGSQVQFTDASDNHPTSWNWTFPGGIPASSTAQHPFVTYRTPGTYPVTLTASNASGINTISKQDFITVNELGIQAVAAKNELCLGDTIFLRAQGNPPGKTPYWEAAADNYLFASGYFMNPYVIPGTVGTYSFRLFAENEAGCQIRSFVEVVVKDVPPKPIITQGSGTGAAIARLTSSSTAGNQWLRDGQAIPGATEQAYEVTEAGAYTVQVTSGGCSSEIAEVVNIGVTAINPAHIPVHYVTVYPNPASQEVVLQVAQEAGRGDFYYTVYNSLGAKVAEGTLDRKMEHWERKVNLAHLRAGHYVVLIRSNQARFSRAFVKQ